MEEKEKQELHMLRNIDFGYLEDKTFKRNSIIFVSLFSAVPILSGVLVSNYVLFPQGKIIQGIAFIIITYMFIPLTVKLGWKVSKEIYFRDKHKRTK